MSTVFVVDDSELTRKSICKLLQLDGHKVFAAAHGRDAWVMLYSQVPDLIVLDLMMSEMDGLTFLRMLRHNHHWSEVPVAILTGQSEKSEMLKDAKELGVSDVILKGVVAGDELEKRLDHLLTDLGRKSGPAAPRVKKFFADAQ